MRQGEPPPPPSPPPPPTTTTTTTTTTCLSSPFLSPSSNFKPKVPPSKMEDGTLKSWFKVPSSKFEDGTLKSEFNVQCSPPPPLPPSTTTTTTTTTHDVLSFSFLSLSSKFKPGLQSSIFEVGTLNIEPRLQSSIFQLRTSNPDFKVQVPTSKILWKTPDGPILAGPPEGEVVAAGGRAIRRGGCGGRRPPSTRRVGRPDSPRRYPRTVGRPPLLPKGGKMRPRFRRVGKSRKIGLAHFNIMVRFGKVKLSNRFCSRLACSQRRFLLNLGLKTTLRSGADVCAHVVTD